MIITCPSCQARYPVDAAAFPPSGRKVRCKKCGHVWLQAPPENAAPEPVNEPAVQSDLGLSPAPAAEDISKPDAQPKVKAETLVAAAAPEVVAEIKTEQQAAPFKFEAATDDVPLFDQEAKQEKKRKGIDLGGKDIPIVMTEIADTQLGMGGKLRTFVNDAAFTRRYRVVSILGWTAVVLMIVVPLSLAYVFRMEIAALWPKTTAVYEAVDKPINLRGIEFRDVSYERQTENGLPVLAVKGKVFNISEETRALPPLRVILRDKEQKELYNWTFSLPEKELATGQSAEFVTRLSSPPAEARDLEVRFVLKGEALGGTSTEAPAAAEPAAAETHAPQTPSADMPEGVAPEAAPAPAGETADHPAP